MKYKIPSLNGLRAISILFVIIWHYVLSKYILSNTDVGENNIFLGVGQLGVNVFFIISGYLITGLLINEEKTYNSVSLKQFYFRRTIRIFPAYYFLLFVYIIFQLFKIISFTKISWITSFTYTKYFYPADVLTGHFWSLSVEEHFYIIWPIIFKYFKSIRKGFAISIIILIPIIRFLAYGNDISWISSISLPQRMDAPMLGCLFAINKDKVLSLIKVVIDKSGFLILIPVLLLIFSICSGLLFTSINWNIPRFVNSLFGSIGTLPNICIGFIMLYSIHFRNIWFQFLNLKILDYLGRLSYSLYLWQQLFLLGSRTTKIIFPYNLICLLIVANVSYFLIEKPFLKLKNIMNHRKKKETVVLIPG